MGAKKIQTIGREFDHSWTEHLSVVTDVSNPNFEDLASMVKDRKLSVSLRKSLKIN